MPENLIPFAVLGLIVVVMELACLQLSSNAIGMPMTYREKPPAGERAEQYRKEAQTCMDVAEGISLKSDRTKMVRMAKHWLELAQKADAKAQRGED